MLRCYDKRSVPLKVAKINGKKVPVKQCLLRFTPKKQQLMANANPLALGKLPVRREGGRLQLLAAEL